MALRTILKDNDKHYTGALSLTNLEPLKARRSMLSNRFAIKFTKKERTKDMFPLAVHRKNMVLQKQRQTD